jgi:DNA-directed RNA polymerase alpha subunit
MELRGLSTRAVNALGRHGITSREQALSSEIMRLLANEKNCGRKTLAEIEAWLQDDFLAGELSSRDVSPGYLRPR